MSVSKKLIKAMEKAGLSSIELSVKSGVPASRISEIVTQKTRNPQMKTLVKLANALGVNVAELTGGEIAPDRSLEEMIDSLPAETEYKMAMKEILKKTPEEIFEWLAEERRKERQAREKV